jgi:hypothetical protein
MEKMITVSELAQELKIRLEKGKGVDCCRDELLRLADLAAEKIGDEKILVNWKE